MKKMISAAFGAVALTVAAMAPAAAADLSYSKGPAVAPDVSYYSPWMVRVRALAVVPQETSKVYAGGALVPGGRVEVGNSFIPELDITYFFTKNIAAELILGVTPHSLKGNSVLGNPLIGRTWLLPPTLTLQYHFTDFGAFKPYIGAGVNYTVFFNNKDRGTFTGLDLDNNFGVALQVGFDYMLNQNWGINVDVKKLWLNTTATGLLGATPVRAKVDIDPWIVGAGITYRF